MVSTPEMLLCCWQDSKIVNVVTSLPYVAAHHKGEAVRNVRTETAKKATASQSSILDCPLPIIIYNRT